MGSLSTPQRQLHFLLFPFMAQGHTIPMVDIAKLLALRDITVTIVTTPLNAVRFESPLRRAIHEQGLHIDVVKLHFPCVEAGLPEGCESHDMLPSPADFPKLFDAAAMMRPQVESLLERVKPDCIVSDLFLPYLSDVANKFGVPRISFSGMSCFCLVCVGCVMVHAEEVDRRASCSDREYFVLPGLSEEIEFTRVQLPVQPRRHDDHVMDSIGKAESEAYGVIVNSFEELEPEYFSEYKNSKRGKAWCIGPVSLTNRNKLDKLQRGSTNNISPSHHSLDWLDAKAPRSVIYVCLGSICNLSSRQLIELALGLEASEKPFIWAIREIEATKGLFKWIVDSGFEDRMSDGRGMVIRGWAPQVSILSHVSVGGFLTHCGWNSILEGISAGIPLVTWPLFGDQFSNEKLVVEVVKIGVRVGAESPSFWDGEEALEAVVKREDVERAVRLAMEDSEEGDGRRKRVEELSTKAKKAVESGGSSFRNVGMLIDDIAKCFS